MHILDHVKKENTSENEDEQKPSITAEISKSKEYTDPFLQGYHQSTGTKLTLPYHQVIETYLYRSTKE